MGYIYIYKYISQKAYGQFALVFVLNYSIKKGQYFWITQ